MKKTDRTLIARVGRWIGYWMVVGASVVVLVFVVAGTWIGVEVKGWCKLAQAKYEGDCGEALIQAVDDEGNSYLERNYAIWSLGMLGEERALPMLEKHYTGIIPEREPYNQGLSQYEMRKAINLARGGTNVAAWLWR